MRMKVFLLIVLLFISTVTQAGKPNNKRYQPPNGFLNYWKIEFSGGATSYFGDLSQYDLNPFKKIANESSPAFALKVTKLLVNDKFGVSGQLLKGGFKYDYLPQYSFQTGLFEYSLQFQANLEKIIFQEYTGKFGISLYTGIGQFFFWSSGGQESLELEYGNTYKPGVPEFVYFIGGILSYEIDDVFSIYLDLSTHQAQNDYLDLKRYGENFDYYSYLGIGVSIYINDFSKPFFKQQDCDAYDALHRNSVK